MKNERIYIKIQTSELCELYKCTPDTLRRWVRLGRLDPTSLVDIVDKYNNRWKIDGRMKRKY